MNNKTLIIILLCVYKIYCQQNKTKINEESHEEEKAEERLETEDLQKAEEDQEAEDREAEEYENRADDKQKETKIEEKSQEEGEAEERLETEDLQKAEEDQEAEEDENKADDKVEEPEKPIEEKESNESDKEQVEGFEDLIKEKEMKNKLEDNISHEENEEYFPKEEMDLESQKEKEAGDPADLFGTNQHYNIPANFDDFGRRFIWAYPYIEKDSHGTVGAAELKLDRDVKDYLEAKKESAKLLTPVKAPPAFVLSIAKQSALLEGTKPKNPSEDIITRNILRTGDFWDSVWKEDVDVDRILRTSNKKSEELERVTVQVEPGSKLYELISKLKKISPTLLYVINKSNDN